jgi:hypothetical protein
VIEAKVIRKGSGFLVPKQARGNEKTEEKWWSRVWMLLDHHFSMSQIQREWIRGLKTADDLERFEYMGQGIDVGIFGDDLLNEDLISLGVVHGHRRENRG